MKRTERVARYEAMLDRVNRAAEQMENALDAFEGVRQEVRALEAYYTSAAWKKDFEADEKGLLPPDLKRGVLSQDGIDHLLERLREIRARMAESSR